MSVDVRPVTAERWSDLVGVFGRRGEDPSWCWCRRFLPTATEESASPTSKPDNRNALREEILRAAVPPGVVAYVEDRPVGWSRVGPRSDFPGVTANRALAKVITEAPGAWWVTCFAVESQHRRSGVGSALLNACVGLARDHGATAVEGHPVDVAALKAARVGGSAVFTGTLDMFYAAGFTEIARTYPTRPVMRLLL